MADARLSLIFAAKDLASGEVRKLEGALHGLASAGGRAGGGLATAGGSIVDFAGKAALIGVGAAVALGGALLAAGKAAADEQVGIVRLGAALKANVPGFDGNTAAIEKLISAREKLGFSDDDLRQSLGELVVQTHDVSKAQNLQALAMDLARKQGIGLGEATDTLIKINNGQYRALKGLGIAIVPVTTAQDALAKSTKHATTAQIEAAKAADDAATKAQALAAIEKAAAGQAEAYGNTTAGMWESIKIAGQDILEDIGGLVLPVLNKLAGFARDNLLPAIHNIVQVVTDWFRANGPLVDSVKGFVSGALATFVDLVSRAVGFVGDLATNIAVWLDYHRPLVESVERLVGNALKAFVDFVQDLPDKIGAIATKVTDWYNANQPLVDGLASLTANAIVEGVKTIVDTFRNMGDLGPIVLGLAAAVVILNAAISANPIVAAVLGIILAVGILRIAWDTNWNGIRDTIQGITATISNNLGVIVPTILTALTLVIARVVLGFVAWGVAAGAAALATLIALAPILIPIAVISAAVAALAYAWEHNFAGIRQVVGGVIEALQHLVGWIQTAVQWINTLIGKSDTLNGLTYAQAHGLAPMPARAGGGPVFPGQTYTVGEARPETLVMGSRGGYVMPSAGGGGGGGSQSSGQPVLIQLVLDGRVLGQVADEHLHYGAAGAFSTLRS